MFRTARITFTDYASNTERTLTAQVFHLPAFDQWEQDEAAADAIERECAPYGDFGIIDVTWVN